MMKDMAAIVLAAGKGVRMRSDLPKVLHPVAGQPMLRLVCRAAATVARAGVMIVTGGNAEAVRQEMGPDYRYALQEQQLGTGHAVQQALAAFPQLPPMIMVLCGDTPLLRPATLQALAEDFLASGASCDMLTAILPDAGAYGRVIRDPNGQVLAVVEARDASPEQLAIREVNSGLYCFRGPELKQALTRLTPGNSQGEYYLTDVLHHIRAAGGSIRAVVCPDAAEISGVNDRVQLAAANRVLRQRINEELMRQGVTMIDPDTTYIDADVRVGRDTVLEPQTYLHGQTVIGAGCHVGPGVKVVDSIVGDHCQLGPFAYLRPGTILADRVKAGHFVEIKKSVIGSGSKVPHLSYIGDAELGREVNIGCGTITCNYDGVNKHRTLIGDRVFVGSNSNFVAPVQVGEGAYIAAGSTITDDVPADSLAIARGRQRVIADWSKTKGPQAKK